MKNKKNDKIKQLIGVSGLFIVLLSGCTQKQETFILETENESETETQTISDAITEEIKAEENLIITPPVEKSRIYVHVCGAVKNPGVYAIAEGSRVFEALEYADGCTENAVMEYVNQAEELMDGEQIYIPFKEDLKSGKLPERRIEKQSEIKNNEQSSYINLNTASVDELTKLSGIGESKAKAIVQYRQEHGRFTAADELMNISGIGENTYQKIKEQVCVQ